MFHLVGCTLRRNRICVYKKFFPALCEYSVQLPYHPYHYFQYFLNIIYVSTLCLTMYIPVTSNQAISIHLIMYIP